MKIVVLDGYTENPGDLNWEELEAIDSLTVYNRAPTDKILEWIGDAEAVYTNKTPISAETIVKRPGLKLTGILATGCDVIDTTTAKANGMVVPNIPTYGTDAAAQYAIALLLELCHRVGEHSDYVKTGEWTHNQNWCFQKHPLMELAGKSFDVIGFGRIGQRTAQIARALGMNVLAFNEYPSKDLETGHCRYVSLDQLLVEASMVSPHCPLFPSTEGIINKDTIVKMKDGVKIIDTSRNPLIVEEDPKEGLSSGKVNGTTVGVISTEPIRKDNPFLGTKNMIITPHTVWTPKGSRQRLIGIATDNLQQFVDGKPQDAVNR